MLVVHVAAQLKLERVHTAQQSLVKLLDHRRIPGEAAEIEMLHRRDQILDLTLHLGIVGDLFAKLGQFVQPLLNRLLIVDGGRCALAGPGRALLPVSKSP